MAMELDDFEDRAPLGGRWHRGEYMGARCGQAYAFMRRAPPGPLPRMRAEAPLRNVSIP
jgi:hypothetical protein